MYATLEKVIDYIKNTLYESIRNTIYTVNMYNKYVCYVYKSNIKKTSYGTMFAEEVFIFVTSKMFLLYATFFRDVFKNILTTHIYSSIY